MLPDTFKSSTAVPVKLRVMMIIKKEFVLVILSDLPGLTMECFFSMFTGSQCHICSEVRVLQLSEELVLIFQEDLTYSRFLLFNVTFGKMFLCRWLWFVTLM